MSENEMILGICWYQPEQWERLREISDDKSDLEETYEEWRNHANTSLKKLTSQGKNSVKCA